ncbi:autotransporter outer membrane beta-barrel domain-containing protein [Phascolarctobacterium faecium]|nr:autotransporter outer membrane beta-barrel domain-containing protein [Phascolarctobacterium faecium]MDM8108740.1 autotransporter outer membrane beta-barrel domain-containing protein [Phascolarctobacterium faecium]
MKHRNLEKAVVLSLILSTGVYGSAWAETTTTGSLWDGENGVNKTVESGDLFIDASLNPGDKGELAGAGPHGIIDVEKGDLTIDTDYNGVDVGYKKDATMDIFADNITITAGENGIFTATEKSGDGTVTIGSENRKIDSLKITSGGQGIDNKSGNVYIYGADGSVFSIHSNTTSGDNINQAAINNERDGEIIINGGTINLSSDKFEGQHPIFPDYTAIFTGDGITNGNGTTTLNFNSVEMNVTGSGIRNTGSGTVSLNTKGSNTIFARYTGTTPGIGYGVYSNGNDGTINVIASETYNPDQGYSTLNGQTGYNNIIYGQRSGIASTTRYAEKNIIADNNNFIGGGFAVNSESKHNQYEDTINIIAGNNNFIGRDMVDEYNNTYTTGTGIRLQEVKNVKVNVESINGETTIDADGTGININGKGENIAVTVKAGTDIKINAGNNGISVGNSDKDVTNDDTKVELIAENGNIKVITNYSSPYSFGHGIHTGQGKVTLNAINNTVGLFKGRQSNEEGAIRTLEGGNVLLEADRTNTILANSTEITKLAEDDVFGDKYAINADREGTVDIKADVANNIIGAVYAKDNETAVNIQNLNKNATVANYIASSTVIHRAGDLDGKETIENPNGEIEVTGMDVISALYAQEGAKINLSGVNNILTYYDDPSDEHTSERAVWAYKGADITIDGNTVISTSSYESSPNDMDIAIAAGTSTNINDPIDMANVNLKYENYNGAKSFIQGDILAAYGGEVNIAPNTANTRAVSDAGINITGNLLAGNDGKLDVDLGNGGILVGRADDYGDAALNNGHGSGDKENGFYNPAFSSEIVRNGTVNLTMGEGSQWYVNGQSWITSVDTSKAQNTLIDLVSANTNLNMDSHALTIGTLKGDTNFRMKLDGNRQYSDMLYIGNGNGTYNIELDEVVTIDDMYADSGEGFKFSGLRFATVGKGSDVDFNVTATDKGFNNIIYTVGKDVYGSNVSNHENDAYNNGDGTSLDKPGNAAVEDLLKDAEQAGAATINTNDIMLLANEPDTGENLDNNENHLNYKLIDMQTVRSDAGETMLNMSRANYSNAIYMDRLNKRLGEARYINDDPEEDEGMWVRVRHDRIGKDEAFRSQNTMYELGYDKRQECDNGKRRVGFAVDYMHGDTGYNDIAGKGEIDRYGLWLYDTWTGNKGHYVDYVAKWGHLQNDFEVYNSEGKVTGDYSNNVFSISAEYGRKKDMGNDWYFEPQAQLQLARVTGADYTTSQGTKVSVDGINSLIGRAGFRIGKDFGEEKQSTLYFKADVLHEFLGDQTIRALDGTTNGWQSVDYENQGTWYDIGIGYAAMLSQSTYAFIDLEQSFGNDNDDTYQINAGVRWTF